MLSHSFLVAQVVVVVVVMMMMTATTSLGQYITRPDIIPAAWNVTYTAPGANISDGYIFIAQRVETPLSLAIYSSSGDIVYFDSPYDITNASNGGFNFRPQILNGEPILTFWEGWAEVAGYGKGNAIVLANNYTILANVSATNQSDFHESRITTSGHIITTVFNTIGGVDTSNIDNGAEDSYIEDGCFQVMTLPEGDPVFTFCSYEAGILPDESYLPIPVAPTTPGASWDYIHVNSVELDSTGNYLLSARHMHCLYYISGETGDILWRLGGKFSNFTGTGINFAWQHDAQFAYEFDTPSDQLANQTTRYISIFDNASDGTDSTQTASNGLIIEVNLANMTATLVTNFTAPGGETDLLATSQGTFELFGSDAPTPDYPNVFMGYGALPVFAEWDANGTALQVVHWGEPGVSQSYRVFKGPWNGYPLTAPDVAIVNSTLYVSWNGATEVATWRIVQGSNTTEVTRNTFETAIRLNSSATDMVQAIALSSTGSQLASSEFVMQNGTLTGTGIVNGTTPAPTTSSTASSSASASSTFMAGGGSADSATSLSTPLELCLLLSLLVSSFVSLLCYI